MDDCEYVVEGFHYTVSDDWITVYRGGNKQYRIRKTERVSARLSKLQNEAYGKAKTTVVCDYIIKHGVPCGALKKEKTE